LMEEVDAVLSTSTAQRKAEILWKLLWWAKDRCGEAK
jgi:hypothetical protein